jgi:hypothetical protein
MSQGLTTSAAAAFWKRFDVTRSEWIGLGLALLWLADFMAACSGLFPTPAMLLRFELWGWMPIVGWWLWMGRRRDWSTQNPHWTTLALFLTIVVGAPMLFLSLMAALFTTRTQVVVADAPPGAPAFYVTFQRIFWQAGCMDVMTGELAGLVLSRVGTQTCLSYELLTAEEASRAHFERLPALGMVALVAGEETVDEAASAPQQLLELYRVDQWPVRRLTPWPAGKEPEPWSQERDRALRGLLPSGADLPVGRSPQPGGPSPTLSGGRTRP